MLESWQAPPLREAVGFSMKLPTIGLISLIAVLLSPFSVNAEIYTWTEKDGTVVFSDQSHENASEVTLAPPSSFDAPSTTNNTNSKNKTPAAKARYKKLTILKPENDVAIRSNNGNITIELAVSPALQSSIGHRLVVTLDGKIVVAPTSTLNHSLNNLDRGTHTLQASIEDINGKVLLNSDAITFHILRHSKLF